jgi:hypothetical protein
MKKKDKSPKKFVDCICPKCTDENGKPTKHRKRIYWTGKKPARKYCNKCRAVVEERERESIKPITIIISGRDVDFHLSKRERSDEH